MGWWNLGRVGIGTGRKPHLYFKIMPDCVDVLLLATFSEFYSKSFLLSLTRWLFISVRERVLTGKGKDDADEKSVYEWWLL